MATIHKRQATVVVTSSRMTDVTVSPGSRFDTAVGSRLVLTDDRTPEQRPYNAPPRHRACGASRMPTTSVAEEHRYAHRSHSRGSVVAGGTWGLPRHLQFPRACSRRPRTRRPAAHDVERDLCRQHFRFDRAAPADQRDAAGGEFLDRFPVRCPITGGGRGVDALGSLAASCNGFSATSIWMVEQLGLAMISHGRNRATFRRIDLTTSGTSACWRNRGVVDHHAAGGGGAKPGCARPRRRGEQQAMSARSRSKAGVGHRHAPAAEGHARDRTVAREAHAARHRETRPRAP